MGPLAAETDDPGGAGPTRRSFLRAAVAGTLAAAAARPGVAGAARSAVGTRAGVPAAPRLPGPPFTLGVASGDPRSDAVVLWTRLAPDPLRADGSGGMPATPVAVRWEVAHDEGFRRVVRRGSTRARPSAAHAVHVDAGGLEPGREYFYRFHAGGEASPVGRTRTAPAPGALPARLRFACTSCQQYEDGYFTAHRALAGEDVDLVAFLGDYIYEDPAGPSGVRRHEGPEPVDLVGYRNRYARYKTDADLQAAHAAFPWLVIWDDHEVANNYAADRAQRAVAPDEFLVRRAAAYRAWWEHQPVRLAAPDGPDLRIYRRLRFGRLLEAHLLDTRQYRSDQPCGSPIDAGPRCAEADAPDATLLGPAQERWLTRGLRVSPARWNLLAQQVMVAQANFAGVPPGVFNLDQWDGYPAARRRLVDALAAAGPDRNPVIVTGDIHSSWVADVTTDFADPSARVVATELVAPSVTSRFPLGNALGDVTAGNPHVHMFEGTAHGYVRATVTPERLDADFRVVSTVDAPEATVATASSWVVEAGRPGARRR